MAFQFLLPLAASYGAKFIGNQLFGGGNNKQNTPNLSEYGLGKEDISSFINLRRAIGRAGIQSQAANASRTAAANLPGALRNSTVPASIQAGIQSQAGDQIAQLEASLSEDELSAMFKSFQLQTQSDQFNQQLGFQKSQANRGFFTDIAETGLLGYLYGKENKLF